MPESSISSTACFEFLSIRELKGLNACVPRASQPTHIVHTVGGMVQTDTDMVLMVLSHYFDAKTLLISPTIGTYKRIVM